MQFQDDIRDIDALNDPFVQVFVGTESVEKS